jgi:PucR family transcriptional regulator, purine catabolism regulatory protein
LVISYEEVLLVPTPTVASLCADLGNDLAPVAGFEAPVTEITAVHISELPDPTGYLSGGELLLTTGLALPKTKTGYSTYVRRLKAADVTALALGLGPIYASPPPLLVSACQQSDLTLLEVPGPTPFQVITKAYWSAVSRAAERRLHDALAAHRSLVTAAASPDPVAATLRSLARAMNGWAALLSDVGEVDQVYPLGMRDDAELARAEIGRLQVAGVHSAASFNAARDAVVVVPLAVDDRIVGYLAVGTPETLDTPQRHVVATACALLSIDAERQQRHESAREATRRCIATLLDMGMVEAARRLAAEVEAPPLGSEGQVLAIRGRDSDASAIIVQRWCAGALAVRVDRHVAWFVIPTNRPPLSRLEKALRTSDATTAAVISEPVRLEAFGAVRSRVIDSLDGVPPGAIRLPSTSPWRFSPDFAKGLDRLIAEERPELAAALAGYLRCHGNWAQASRNLGIHRNTLRYRVGRCEATLGVDLDDPDVCAELWLSMRLRGVA